MLQWKKTLNLWNNDKHKTCCQLTLGRNISCYPQSEARNISIMFERNNLISQIMIEHLFQTTILIISLLNRFFVKRKKFYKFQNFFSFCFSPRNFFIFFPFFLKSCWIFYLRMLRTILKEVWREKRENKPWNFCEYFCAMQILTNTVPTLLVSVFESFSC